VVGCDTVVADAEIGFGGIVFALGPDTMLCLDYSALLRIPHDAVAWQWSDGSIDSTLLVGAGSWDLRVIDSAGCITSDTRTVTAFDCDCPVFVPNAFTPNADGINEGFKPIHQCAMRAYALRLFDRWGSRGVAYRGPARSMGRYAGR